MSYFGSAHAASGALEAESAVDRAVDEGTRAKLVAIRGWRGLDNPWMREDEDEEGLDYSYINLLANPERYTGYKVPLPPCLYPCCLVPGLAALPAPSSCVPALAVNILTQPVGADLHL